MSLPQPPKLNVGEKIKEQFVVKKKLGEGACGAVYLVQNLKNSRIIGAMKIEAIQKSKDDEILKMEVCVLKRLQRSKHVCRLFMSGRTPTFSYVIMSLLGKELGELRRRLTDRKMSLSTVLRIGYQCTEALQDMHTAGFIHRDVKPSNFSCGVIKKDVIYIFDFGLARQIFILDKDGKMKVREPRTKVSFRGTVRYCSINIHLYKEHGRQDDMISVIYLCIECLTRALPWKGMARKDSHHLKETISDKVLFKDCPPSFHDSYQILKKLTYHDLPPYEAIKDLFKKDMDKHKIKMSDMYDWQRKQLCFEDHHDEKEKRKKKADERAEIEKMEDTDTLRDVEESIETEVTDDNTEQKGFDRENTLDNVADMPEEKREKDKK